MNQERKEELEQEERESRVDEAFREFKENNLLDLKLEFCEENDEFEEYCRSEFNRWEKEK